MKTMRKVALALLACALVGLLASCGFNAEDHAKALLPVLQTELNARCSYDKGSFDAAETAELTAKAESILKSMQEKGSAALDADADAVTAKSEAKNKNDTAGLTKEAKAIVEELNKKYVSSFYVVSGTDDPVVYKIRFGFAFGKVDGTERIVVTYEMPDYAGKPGNFLK